MPRGKCKDINPPFAVFISLKHTESIESPISKGTEKHDVKGCIESGFSIRRQYGYMQQDAVKLPPLPHCSPGCRADDELEFEISPTVPHSRPCCETWYFAAETYYTVRDRDIQWFIAESNLQRRLGSNGESGTLIDIQQSEARSQ